MSPPRLTIAAMMGLVVLVALNFAAIAFVVRIHGESLMTLLLGAMPMANLLAIAAMLRYQRASRGESTHFLTAFLIAGSIESAVFVALALEFPVPVMGFLGRTIIAFYSKLLGRMEIGKGTPMAIAIGILLYVTYLTAPQILIASFVGWINLRNHPRISVEQRDLGRPIENPAAPPTSPMI